MLAEITKNALKRFKEEYKRSYLYKIDKIIDFTRLKSVISCVRKSGGRKGYDTIFLFKCVLLSNWHNISDRALISALKTNFDFIKFTGAEKYKTLPSRTTISNFRKSLVEHNLSQKILDEINICLESANLKLKNDDKGIVDGTLIESYARPNKILKLEDMPVDREEVEEAEDKYIKVQYCKDEAAKWLLKGRQSILGFKGLLLSDSEGFYTRARLYSANRNECFLFIDFIKDIKFKKIFGDKGYASKKNREFLLNNGCEPFLMFKASKNKPLTADEKNFNKEVSKVRYVIERAFGTLKQKFKFHKTRYMGLAKVEAEMFMKCICCNLLKAVNKISVI